MIQSIDPDDLAYIAIKNMVGRPDLNEEKERLALLNKTLKGRIYAK